MLNTRDFSGMFTVTINFTSIKRWFSNLNVEMVIVHFINIFSFTKTILNNSPFKNVLRLNSNA